MPALSTAQGSGKFALTTRKSPHHPAPPALHAGPPCPACGQSWGNSVWSLDKLRAVLEKIASDLEKIRSDFEKNSRTLKRSDATLPRVRPTLPTSHADLPKSRVTVTRQRITLPGFSLNVAGTAFSEPNPGFCVPREGFRNNSVIVVWHHCIYVSTHLHGLGRNISHDAGN